MALLPSNWQGHFPQIQGKLNTDADKMVIVAMSKKTESVHANPEPSRSKVAVYPLSETEKAYIAGFVDGEGAFTVNRRFHQNMDGLRYVGYSAYLEIGNTDKGVIDWLHDVLGITCNVFKQVQKPPRRPMYRLRMSGKQSMIVTGMILPYLKVKKGMAEKFLDFPLQHRRLDRSKSIEVFESLRTLNRENGKGRGSLKYPGELSCVCRDLTGDTLQID